MASERLKAMFAPIADPRRRRRLAIFYRRPTDFLRRAYLHLEDTLLKRQRVWALPARAKLSTGYGCNLRCPLCPTGRREPHPPESLTAAMTRALLPRLNSVGTISLFGWGEPFLNPEIFEIIDLLKKARKTVYMDSNLHIKDMDVIDRLDQCPVDLLSISLDGADQESYSKYRVGGSFDLVIRNLKRLVQADAGPKLIQWQYLVSRKNQHALERARLLSKELGVELVVDDIGMYNEMFYESSDEVKDEWWTAEQRARLSGCVDNTGGCRFLYNDPHINCNGDVVPCCHATCAPKHVLEAGYQNVFGNLLRESLWDIWNNELYQQARGLFNGRQVQEASVKPICLRCRKFLGRNGGSVSGELPVFAGVAQILKGDKRSE